MTEKEFKNIISTGENERVEFKSTWKDEFLKHICGFANQRGGTLFIGIEDTGKI